MVDEEKPSRHGKWWSESEKEFIKENYKELSVGELAEELGRTEKATRNKIERMGIKLSSLERAKKNSGGGRNLWTEKEIQFLKENYTEKTDEEIGTEIGRSASAVAAKRARLGLYKYQKSDDKGRYLDSDGYIKAYDGRGNRRFYHKMVAEDMLGRELKEEEKVHHINFDKTDNREENLFVCRNRSHHFRLHHQATKLLGKLVKQGVVKFDENKEEYRLCEEKRDGRN